eukprot:gene10057-biopygen8911
MAHGARRTAHGAWRAAHGAWRAAHGAWRIAHGAWRAAHGARRMAHGVDPHAAAVADTSPYGWEWCVMRVGGHSELHRSCAGGAFPTPAADPRPRMPTPHTHWFPKSPQFPKPQRLPKSQKSQKSPRGSPKTRSPTAAPTDIFDRWRGFVPGRAVLDAGDDVGGAPRAAVAEDLHRDQARPLRDTVLLAAHRARDVGAVPVAVHLPLVGVRRCREAPRRPPLEVVVGEHDPSAGARTEL